MNKKTAAVLCMALSGVATVCGCGAVQQTSALPADAFVANQPVIGSSAGQGIDHPGQVVYDEHKRPPHEASEATRISPEVADTVKGPPDIVVESANGSDFPPPQNAPTTAPATTQGATGVTLGQYQTIGTVIAVVNGEPIFADNVLSKIERPLKAEAMAHNEAQFRATAYTLVRSEIYQLCDNADQYAAAQKGLEKKDQQYADMVTAQWRKEQIDRAGGAEAVARQKAAEDGQDFDELLREQRRAAIVEIFIEKKLLPRVQISSQDMRQYYLNNIAKYQKIAAAKYRLIWIGATQTGGREAALEKAKKILAIARQGEDFADLAGQFNDDKALHDNHGKVGDEKGWMDKDSFVQPAVEAAIWKLRPTEISDPIFAPYHGDGYWIAKLEEVRPGDTAPFQSPKVQDDIYLTLRSAQIKRLEAEYIGKFRHDRVIDVDLDKDPRPVAIVMEMVMQKYHTWVGK